VSLPGVAELLRPVGPGPATDPGRQASGREAHPLKITVYLSADEFLDLERARLALRVRGIGVDRGRLVREAIAVLIADLETGIDASVIIRRLHPVGQPGSADVAALVSGARDDGGPVNGARADVARVSGARDDGGPVNGARADVARVSGARDDGGPVNGAPADVAPVSGGAVNGGAVNGAPVNGAPAGRQ
jgi:hypothetical protein